MEGCLDDMKASYQRIHVVLENGAKLPVHWPEGAESVRQEGPEAASHALQPQRRCNSRAGAIHSEELLVERFPVNLKEIFLEHVGVTEMLFLKGWLETRYRLLFALGFAGLFSLSPIRLELTSPRTG